MNSDITGSSSIVDGSIGGFGHVICYVMEVDVSMCKGRQGATLEKSSSASADGEHIALRQIHWLITHSPESNVLCIFVCVTIRFVNPM